MTTLYLTFRLASDALFGRGDGVAGLVDAEVQHDEMGCPFLGGRALKGVLVQECADILSALPAGQQRAGWEKAAHFLFGRLGSAWDDGARMAVGDAQLPADLREALTYQIRVENKLTPNEVLNSLTTLRRQTAIEEKGTARGVAKEASLRTSRVILRETPFEALLSFSQKPGNDELALLAACAKALQRVGTHVNRGFGRLEGVDLKDSERRSVLDRTLEDFRKKVLA